MTSDEAKQAQKDKILSILKKLETAIDEMPLDELARRFTPEELEKHSKAIKSFFEIGDCK